MLEHNSVDGSRRVCEHVELFGVAVEPVVDDRRQGDVAAVGGILQPRVRQHTGCAQPQPSILNKKSGDEVFGLIRNVHPFVGVELEPAVLDVVEQVRLTIIAGLPLVPAAGGSTVARKRGISTQEDVQHHTQGPKITSFIIFEIHLVVLDEGLHDLGGHELGGSDRGQQHRGRVTPAPAVELNPAAQVEVAQLDRDDGVLVEAEHVLRLQVSVGYACK